MTHHRIRDLKGKAIVDLKDGIKIGVFEDLLVSPEQLASKVLVTNKGTVFNRRLEGIPVEEVRVWGRDVILVENQDVIRALDSFSDYQTWVLASEQLKQRSIVSIDGKRVGVVDDLALDDRGRVMGISLGQVYVKGPLAQMKEIPIEAVRSLGPDVVIVDLSRADVHGLMDEPDLSPDESRTLHTPYAPGGDYAAGGTYAAGQSGEDYAYSERDVTRRAYSDGGAQIYDDRELARR
jgi:sporulation protein YlmC with PRC-barrel domain